MIHCLTPFGMLGSYSETRRFSEIRVGGGGNKEGFWQGIENGTIFGEVGFGYLVFGSGNHWVDGGLRRVNGGVGIELRRRDGRLTFWSWRRKS